MPPDDPDLVMYPFQYRPLIEAALHEDLGAAGDVTTEAVIPASAMADARLIARQGGTIAGLEMALEAFRILDPALGTTTGVADGDRVDADTVLATLSGRARPILTAERTALNFLGHLSGIATAARRFVDSLEGTGCRVLDTRKTTPGWRTLEKQAAASGGAVNHRAGLYDMVLIKENHIRAAGGVTEALAAAIAPARRAGLEVEIEVTDLAELDQALAGDAADARPDRILLDNMSIDQLEHAVARVRALAPPRPLLEASGGVTLETAHQIGATGVDFLSAGAITHSAPALDLSLQVRQA